MRLWRLVKPSYAAAAFDGEGARLYGGRWNSPGTRVAYASGNSALAVLEVLVHLGDVNILPSYSLITASLPDALIGTPPESSLSAGWRASPAPSVAQGIGDAWIQSGSSVGLCLPSAVVRSGSVILVNPSHPDFVHFVVESIELFEFDPRLLK